MQNSGHLRLCQQPRAAHALRSDQFYREYGQCKFKPCMFRHVDTIIDFDALKNENENIFERLKTIDTNLEALNVKILESEAIIDKLNQVEKRMEIFIEMKKHIGEKDCHIGFLEKRINDIETNLFNKDKVIDELAEKIENIKTSKGKKQEKIKCSFCDFETISKQGLKVHVKRKHTLPETESFPNNCEICNDTLKDKSEAKDHLRKHSYKTATYKCSDCDFVGENTYTMNVHVGKHHMDVLECGLCDHTAKTLDDLELHLFTCETFKCLECGEKEKTLDRMKTHIKEFHENASFYHFKMNKNDYNEVRKLVYY